MLISVRTREAILGALVGLLLILGAPSSVEAGSGVTLTSLTLSRGSLVPAFSGTTTSYDVRLANAVASVTVTATASDPNAVIKVNGSTVAGGSPSAPLPLAPGSNAIAVTVTSQDGSSTASYTVSTYRALRSAAGGYDVNADGFGDIVFQHTTTNAIYVWKMNGTSWPVPIYLGALAPGYRVVGLGDVNGDNTFDLVARDIYGNNLLVQLVGSAQGIVIARTSALPSVKLNWLPAGIGDFDGDGKADVFWREASGYNQLQYGFDGTGVRQSGVAGVSIDWKVGAIADFDGDGRDDILWRNINGMNYLWHMDGPNVASEAAVPGLGADWKLVGVADFDGDGKPDLLWRNINGSMGFWMMNDAVVKKVVNLPGVTPDWRVAGVADYNADGYPDILWEQPVTGTRVVWFLVNGAYAGEMVLQGTGDAGWQVVMDTVFATQPEIGACGAYSSAIRSDLPWQNTTTQTRLKTPPLGGMGSDTVWAVRFTTPNAALSSPGHLSAAEWLGGPVFRTYAISKTPCDFSANLAPGSVAATAMTVSVDFTVGLATPVLGWLNLDANTTYYLNIRNRDSFGNPSCLSGPCDMYLDLLVARP